MRRTFLAAIAGLALAQIAPPTSRAQPPEQEKPTADDTADLQKATQNPVASLVSVPLQNNSNFGIGPFDRNQNVLNIQPVIPIRVSQNWNMIIRWIAPVIWQPAPGTANLEVFGIEENTPTFLAAKDVQAQAGVFGFGDMMPTFFLSPAKAHKVIWGAGPVFVLPTATSRALGQGKLSMGPSIVALVQPGHWTIGALINNVWSIAGPSGRKDVNQMTLQYFVNGQLEGCERQRMDGAGGRWCGSGFPLGIPASQCIGAILRQRCASEGRFSLGDAATTCVPISEAARNCEDKLAL